jgi:hypothetical protein
MCGLDSSDFGYHPVATLVNTAMNQKRWEGKFLDYLRDYLPFQEAHCSME